MDSIKNQARTAGLLYLFACLPAPFALIFVPHQLVVPGNALATADHLRNSGFLLRMGIAGELINACLLVFAVIALYRLFKGTSRTLAQAMAGLILVSVPVSLFNIVNSIAALTFTSGADFLAPFSRAQLDSLAYMSMRLHGQGLNVAQIFWGLWLFPFGILAMRSRLVPGIVGVLLMLAGYGYVASSFAALFVPKLAPMVLPMAAALALGEFPMIIWLIWGVKESSDRTPSFPLHQPAGAAG